VHYQTALARIAYGRGDKDAALAQMRTAAYMENASEKSLVSPRRLIGTREL